MNRSLITKGLRPNVRHRKLMWHRMNRSLITKGLRHNCLPQNTPPLIRMNRSLITKGLRRLLNFRIYSKFVV